MLAPRKKLWSTPDNAVDEAMERIGPLSSSDNVVDIGCGDGKVILRWASRLSRGIEATESDSPSFLGVDIDDERIRQARLSLARCVDEGSIHGSVRVTFVCANALEQQSLFMDATVVFLYLIPRGLRIIHPMLRQVVSCRSTTNESGSSHPSLRVITYMAPLVGEVPYHTIKIAIPHQPGAHWPLYIYRIEASTGSS